MINDQSDNEFFIIGLTGPLRSGCTELAEKIVSYCGDQKNNHYTNLKVFGAFRRRVKKNINFLEGRIYKLYKDLKKEKKKEERREAAKNKDSIQIIRISKELKEVLIKRTFLNVLRDKKILLPKFNYISMSNMILKIAFEKYLENPNELGKYLPHLSENGNLELDQKDKIIDIIREQFEKNIGSDKSKIIKMIKSFNNCIKNKDFSNFKLDDCYCKYIGGFRKLKNDINGEIYEYHQEWLQDFGDNLRKSGNPFESENKPDNNQ